MKEIRSGLRGGSLRFRPVAGGGLLLLSCAIVLLQGCMVLPIPTPEHKVLAGKAVTPDQVAFLKPGITTKTEVMNRLGGPDAIWEDARLFVYQWTMRQGILIWAVGGGYTGAAGVEDIEKRYMLLIQFDGRDRVRRFEKVVRPAFTPYGDFLKQWIGGNQTSIHGQTDERR